jgi:hypothetical protein
MLVEDDRHGPRFAEASVSEPGAEQTSAPGRDRLVALTAIDIEDMAGDE